MSPLDEFLETGALPFIGRTRELAQIVEHWRTAIRGDGMRALLLEGEAGVGKSRLVHEASGRIAEERGTVVHAKLYAELTTAIAPLLHDAIARTELGRQSSRAADDASLGAITEMLRRIGRLRPLAIVIEDVHLLSGAPVRELVQLLESIEDEPVAVVLTARTQDHPVRRVIDRWPLDVLTLSPLGRDDIEAIWRDLFGATSSGDETVRLDEATLGNPLALRSALQGALRTSALVNDHGAWRAEPAFATIAARGAASLVEGMLLAVKDDDRVQAGRLAALGEVFSREAALRIVDAETLRRLSAAGLVHELPGARPSLPLLEPSASMPIGFSHSLVHRRLSEETTAPSVELAGLVAERAPLYSVQPFTILARDPAPAAPLAVVRGAIDTLLNVALGLDRTSDWGLAIVAHRAAERLFEAHREEWTADERRARSIAIAARTLALLRREMISDDYGEALERLRSLTEGTLPPELAWYRLALAIAEARRGYLLGGYRAGLAVYDGVRELVAAAPELRFHQQYVLVLQTFAQLAEENDDATMRREIEREYETLVSAGALSDDTLMLARTQVLPYLLTLFASRDELDRRIATYRELKNLEHDPSPMARMLVHAMLPSEPKFLMKTGRVDELLAFIDAQRDAVRAQGMLAVSYTLKLYRLWGEILLGLDDSEIVRRSRELAAGHAEINASGGPGFGDDARLIAGALLVRGDDELARAIAAKHGTTIGDVTAAGDDIIAIDDIPCARRRLAGDAASKESRQLIERALAWLEERRLDAVMRSLLEEHGGAIAAKDLAAWRKRVAAIAAEREASRAPADGESRLRITMLGRIEVLRPGGTEPVQPRGARQKSFLGAMVAREMLAKPFERDEFLEAAGIEQGDDPKLARDAVNSAIYRLRDIVGHDAVLTDEETPRLDMDLVRVDLVDAHRRLREADEALRRGTLSLAAHAALEALEITRGEVPFPALYEPLFEAMREDFENQLRSTVIAVARRLLDERDPAGAAAVLERSFAATPDDEEIADLYCDALERLGRRVEAERVRLRMEAEA